MELWSYADNEFRIRQSVEREYKSIGGRTVSELKKLAGRGSSKLNREQLVDKIMTSVNPNWHFYLCHTNVKCCCDDYK